MKPRQPPNAAFTWTTINLFSFHGSSKRGPTVVDVVMAPTQTTGSQIPYLDIILNLPLPNVQSIKHSYTHPSSGTTPTNINTSICLHWSSPSQDNAHAFSKHPTQDVNTPHTQHRTYDFIVLHWLAHIVEENANRYSDRRFSLRCMASFQVNPKPTGSVSCSWCATTSQWVHDKTSLDDRKGMRARPAQGIMGPPSHKNDIYDGAEHHSESISCLQRLLSGIVGSPPRQR